MSHLKRVLHRRRMGVGIPTPQTAVPDLGRYQVRQGRKVLLIDQATGEVVKSKIGAFWPDVPVRESEA